MQILCLTSLIYRANKNLQNWQRYVDSKWVFSEIQIGKRKGDTEKIYYFVLFRDHQKVFEAKMTKGSMKVVNWKVATDSDSDSNNFDFDFIVLEIETAEDNQFLVSSGACIESIKVRCIKVPKYPRFIEEIKNGLIKHAQTIEKQLSHICFNGEINIIKFLKDSENVIKKIGVLKIENEGGKKAQRNRYSEINCAIKDLCDEIHGSPDNVKKGSKHDTFIEKSTMTIVPRKRPQHVGRSYDFRTDFQNIRNVYGSCKELKFYKANIPAINPRWFDSQSLRILDFNNITVFKTPNAWPIFLNNIGRLSNLFQLNLINCSLETIPDELFTNISTKLFILNLEGNNLHKIPTQIKKLKNLMFLNVSNNSRLKSEGIPWEHCPRSLEDIELQGTSIRAIPQSVRSSIKSHILKDDVFGREDINFEDEIEFDDYSEVDLKVEDLFLNNLHINDFNDAKLLSNIKTLDLSFTELKTFKFSRTFKYLTDLLLNNNQLITVPWESLPTSLNTIDFHKNHLTEIGSIKHLKNLGWFDISYNNICTIKDNEFNHLNQLTDINLSFNSLTQLPKNFEKINSLMLCLNLRHNKFNYKEQNLSKDLWDKLPEFQTLNLCENRLGKLPCDLTLQLNMQNYRAEIIAIDCDIHYICSRLFSKITFLNVLKNPISTFSFVPKCLLSMPSKEIKIEFTNSISEKVLLMDSRSIVKSKTVFNKHNDDEKLLKNLFEEEIEEVPETEFCNCNCCAVCGRQETTKFEQKMIMDICLLLTDEVKGNGESYDYRNKGIYANPSETWTANVQTKLCNICKDIFKGDNEVLVKSALKECTYQSSILNSNSNSDDSNSINEEDNDFSSCPLCNSLNTNLFSPSVFQQNFYREIKIPYNPPSKKWILDTCKRLNLPLSSYALKHAISWINISECQPSLTIPVWGDGHSGYQSLSYLITGTLSNYQQFRHIICDTILQNSDLNFENLKGFKNAKKEAEIKKNVSYFVDSEKEWMNEMDLAAAADMLQCNIAVWERNGHWTLYNSLSFAKGLTIQHEAILEHPTILLNNSNCEHNFFNPVINVVPRNGENDERIFDDVIMEEEEEEEQNLGMENDRDTFQNMDVDELTKNMQELNLIFNEHPGNTETLNLSSLNIENFDDRDMPSEVKTLNLSKNKLEYLRFQKNYKFLKRLDLDNNKLKDIAWETFPIFLEYISLNNNFITSIINLQIHFKFLKHLNLNNNQLSSIPWEDLPISLKVISLNRNYLTSIKTVKHLKQLRRISMSRNKLTEITPDFNELKNLNEIELDYNNLKSLPKGFELIQTLNEDGLSINLACNKFDYEKQDLNEDLWTKLPLIKRLYIWENKIDTLPCQLADKLEADSIIIASDCYIVHVCPKIYSKFKKLDLNDNFLDSLTFIPATILQPPKKQHKIAVESSFDQKVLNMHVSISKPPETFPKFLEKPKYSFNKVKARENLNKIQCKCCAVCGNDQNTFNIQQMMVMDFNLCIDFEYEEVENNYDTKETIFPSGEWISKIRTRLCNSCKNELLKKCENSFETFINENSEIKSKQARIEETDNIDLKECHRSMNKNNDQINKELINQQQPSTSSSMIVPLIRNNYLMEVCSYNSAPIPENIEEQRGQDFRATEIFMQETTQEQNLAVENNATFNWNPVGQLQSSKFPLNDHLYHHTTDPTVSTISEIWQQNNEMLADSVYTDTYISSFTAFNDSYLGESLNQTFKQQPLNIQESHFTSNFPDDPTTIDNFSNIIQDISPGQTFEEYLESQYFPQPILPLNNNIFEASLPQSNNNNINSHEDPQAATSSSTTYYYYTNL